MYFSNFKKKRDKRIVRKPYFLPPSGSLTIDPQKIYFERLFYGVV